MKRLLTKKEVDNAIMLDRAAKQLRECRKMQNENMTADDIATFKCDCGCTSGYFKSKCKGVPMCKHCKIPMVESTGMLRDITIRQLTGRY